jgi:hypothetical protein
MLAAIAFASFHGTRNFMIDPFFEACKYTTILSAYCARQAGAGQVQADRAPRGDVRQVRPRAAARRESA